MKLRGMEQDTQQPQEEQQHQPPEEQQHQPPEEHQHQQSEEQQHQLPEEQQHQLPEELQHQPPEEHQHQQPEEHQHHLPEELQHQEEQQHLQREHQQQREEPEQHQLLDRRQEEDGQQGEERQLERGSRYSQEKLQRMLADVITNHFPIADVLLLLKSGSNPNGGVTKGLRPLHYAAYENDVACARVLLDHGANVNSCDDVGYTPLHIAAKYGHDRVVRLLLEHDAVVNFVEGQEGGEEASKVLASLTEHPLSLASENNHAECLELLLLYGADPNRKTFLGHEINLIPLENTKCLQLMLQYGADPDAVSRGGLTPLMKAAKQQQVEAAKVLLSHGANVNAQCPPRFDRRRAIHFAAMSGQVDITRLLLSAGALTSRPVDYPFSPLYEAIVHDRPDVARVLLEYGADPDEPTDDGCCPLQVACSNTLKRQREIIEHLLAAGAQPNFCRQFFSYIGPSLAPLVEYLSYSEDYDYGLVRLFLQYGAHVNMRVPTRLLKIKDPCGILGQVRKLRPYEDIFCLLVDAARDFDAEVIARDNTMSNSQRTMLLDAAVTPRSLKQLSRIALLDAIRKPIPRHVDCLSLPTYLKDYLQFNTF